MFAAPASWRQVTSRIGRVVQAVEERAGSSRRERRTRASAPWHDELVGEHLSARRAIGHSTCSRKTSAAAASACPRRPDRRSGSSASPPTPPAAPGRARTRSPRRATAAANTGSGPVSYHHSNGAYSCDVALRVDADRARRAARACPGPGACAGRRRRPAGSRPGRSGGAMSSGAGARSAPTTSARPSTRARRPTNARISVDVVDDVVARDRSRRRRGDRTARRINGSTGRRR